MANTFHYAVPAGNLNETLKFYRDVLGCKTGNGEEGHWIDVDFWGNELTLHQTESKQNRERHHVDMGNVCVPHFGVHLDKETYHKVKKRIESSGFQYLDEPYIRFKGTEFEQETFFVEDPHGNVLEIKTMVNPEVLFKKNDCS